MKLRKYLFSSYKLQIIINAVIFFLFFNSIILTTSNVLSLINNSIDGVMIPINLNLANNFINNTTNSSIKLITRDSPMFNNFIKSQNILNENLINSTNNNIPTILLQLIDDKQIRLTEKAKEVSLTDSKNLLHCKFYILKLK